MSCLPVVTIKSTPGRTNIFLDGEEVKSVRYFKVEQEVRQEVPTVTLEVLAREVIFEGKAGAEVGPCGA